MLTLSLFVAMAVESALKQLPAPKPIPRIGIPRNEVPRRIGPAGPIGWPVCSPVKLSPIPTEKK